MKYCVYFTIYQGNLLPPFYIGSSSVEKIKKGYHGSVLSLKWRNVWEQEIKNNPQLFKTIIIPEQFANTKEDIFDLELKWQIEFDVVKNNLFTNMCFAKGNFFSNSESAKKAVQTRRKNGRYIDSEETRKKKSLIWFIMAL